MPDWRAEVLRRLEAARLGGAAEADVVDELAQHLEDRYAELRAAGESEPDARRIALLELEEDGVLARRVRRAVREPVAPAAIGTSEGAGFLNGVASDFRVGLRLLRRAPGFTLVATLVIALGIGANTAIFSVVNALLLRPLPGVRAPEQLATVYTSDYSGPRFGASSYPDFEAIRETGVFEDVAVYRPTSLTLSLGERGVQLMGEVVSAGYFDVLGVRPAAGRFFGAPEAGATGTASTIVVSHSFWQEELGGVADVIGRALRVNGTMLTIVGVAPDGFQGSLRGVRMDAWVPVSTSAAGLGLDLAERGDRGLLMIGRMRAGLTAAAAQQRLAAVAAGLHETYPDYWTDIDSRSRVLTVLPESDTRVPQQVRGPVVGMLTLLMIVAAVVLLIACSNVANLLLSRASARRAEMGIRLSLGATRGRIVRQLLAESVLLAVIGGVAGVLLAFWLMGSLDAIPLPAAVRTSMDIPLDGRVIAFAAGVTLLTGIIFGLAPALHASRAPAPLLREGAPSGARSRLRNGLVIVQVAASVVLLVGGGLFLRSLQAAQAIDIGIDTENMTLVSLDLRTEGYSPEQSQQFYADLQERVGAVPGVTSVTLAQRVPLSGSWSRRGISVQGYTPAEGEDMEVNNNLVSPGYFEALGIPLLRGRGFTEADRAGAPGVVVVNEAFVRRFWPGADALGRRIYLEGPESPPSEVVGVVPDAKYRSLTEEPLPYMYMPYLQRPSPAMLVQVRTAFDPAGFAETLRAHVRALAPGVPTPTIATLRSRVALATMPQRIAAIVLTVLGALALGIAAIGLYGVISYVVLQRTHEIGIRTALGAAAGDVARMVVAQGLRLALIGVAIGVVLALALSRLLGSLLLVSPADPFAILATAALLTAVAVLASWLPARRAARVDPLIALRAE